MKLRDHTTLPVIKLYRKLKKIYKKHAMHCILFTLKIVYIALIFKVVLQ